MKYFIVHRLLPSPSYEYPSHIQKWEKLTDSQLSNISYSGKVLRYGHQIPGGSPTEGKGEIVGMVLVDWKGIDGSKMGLSFIDDSTQAGKEALGKVKDGRIRHTSPLYDLKVMQGQYHVLLDKEYKDVALVENPDFGGDNGCVIFFGAPGGDLNINTTEVLSGIEGKIGTEFRDKFSNVIEDISNRRSITGMADQQQQQTQQTTPQAMQQQQQQVNAQPAQAAPTSVTPTTPEKVQGENFNDISDIVNAVLKDPTLLDKLDTDNLKKGFLELSNSHAEVSRKRKATEAAQPNPAVQTTPVAQPPKDSPQQPGVQRQPPTREYSDLLKNVTEMAQNKVAKINDLLNRSGNALTSYGPFLDPNDIKNGVQRIGKVIENEPNNPMMPVLNDALDMVNTLVVAHAQGVYSNTVARDVVAEAERGVKANGIANYFNRKSTQTTTQNVKQNIPQTTDGKLDHEAWIANMTKLVSERAMKGDQGQLFTPTVRESSVKFDF